MYIGASPFKARNVSSMILYVTRCFTGSQWSFFNIGVMYVCMYVFYLVESIIRLQIMKFKKK